jgi:hypothetical protein
MIKADRLPQLIPVILDMRIRVRMREVDGHPIAGDDLQQGQDDAHSARVVVDSLEKLGLIDLERCTDHSDS